MTKTDTEKVNSQLRRLILAAALSGLGFVATFTWYNSTQNQSLMNLESPLAQVGLVSEEVLRRPPTRLLWHSVNTGDSLFNGEAIRTSVNGEVRIQFEDGRFIDLESDSLIVLSKAEGEVSLDLMEGSLFVNSQQANQAAGSESLVLNSAQGKVDLSRASASLSKASGQNLNLQVVEGSAQIESTDGKTQEISKGKAGTIGTQGLQFDSNQIKIISPLPNKAVYLNPNQKPEIDFKWSGIPENWKIEVLSGESRRQLKSNQELQIGTNESKELFSFGRHYWRLKAVNPEDPNQKVESPIYRLDVLPRSTPTIIYPVLDAKIEIEQLPTALELQWQKSEEATEYIIEVATDAQLKNKIKFERLSKVDRINLDNLAAGSYYWRLSAIYPDTDKPWTGIVQKFDILQKAETPAVSIQVNWDNVKPEQYYITEPTLDLKWKAESNSESVASWKVSWKNITSSNELVGLIETTDTSNQFKLTEPGQYQAVVEAYDKKARLIGTTKPIDIQVSELPKLASPQFLSQEEVIKAENSGRSTLNWTTIDGAVEYKLIVKNLKDQSEVLNKSYSSNQTILQNLMPGEYSLEITTIDQFGRSSTPLAPKTLIVPDKSNLRAPAMKKVKVN